MQHWGDLDCNVVGTNERTVICLDYELHSCCIELDEWRQRPSQYFRDFKLQVGGVDIPKDEGLLIYERDN